MATKIIEKTGIPGSPCNKGERNRAMMAPVAGSKAGVIVYWTGTTSSIPTGWALCNGSSNSAGSGLNLTTGHPFCKMTSTGAGTYVTAQPTGLSEPHTHGGSIGAEEPPIVVTVELKKTNITETKLEGKHTHPHGLDDPSGAHTHSGGHHVHEFTTTPGSEAVGNPLGADHSHGGATESDTVVHTAADVADALADHPVEDTHHAHGLSVPGSPEVIKAGTVPILGTIHEASYGDGDEEREKSQAHEPTGGVLSHSHTHELTLDSSNFPEEGSTDVHTHTAIAHSHQIEITDIQHTHHDGDHPHDYEITPEENHKHPVTDKYHKHPAGSIDTHTHSIVAISPDDGHTHEVNVSGIMLMPIENLSDTAVPGVSGLGRRTPYTCSDSEDRRNFSRQADVVDGLPAGIILMWSRPTSTIPNGWGIADSYGNSTGSGLNVVNWLIVHTGTNSEVGVSWRIGGARDGWHDHTVALENKTVSADLENAFTEINTVTGAGSHGHSGSLAGDGRHKHHGGGHTSVGFVVPKQMRTSEDGEHPHNGTTSSEAVAAHISTQVVAMVEDHPDHTHRVTQDFPPDEGEGGPDHLTQLDRSGGVKQPNALRHLHVPDQTLVHQDIGLGHDHDVTVVNGGKHYHWSSSHGHSVHVYGDGKHDHYGGPHSHPFDTNIVADHTHNIDDPGHTHPIEIDVHTHVAVATDGRHTHEEGKPKRCHLIPIEKLP